MGPVPVTKRHGACPRYKTSWGLSPLRNVMGPVPIGVLVAGVAYSAVVALVGEIDELVDEVRVAEA